MYIVLDRGGSNSGAVAGVVTTILILVLVGAAIAVSVYVIRKWMTFQKEKRLQKDILPMNTTINARTQ